MDIFDKIIKKVEKTTKVVMQKSTDVVEITKVKLAISDTKNQIDSRLRALGKLVYDASGPEYSEDNSADSLIEELNELYSQLKEHEERLASLKSEVICPKCGLSCSEDSVFCKKCCLLY